MWSALWSERPSVAMRGRVAGESAAAGVARDATRSQARSGELARQLGWWTSADGGYEITVPELTCWRISHPVGPGPVVLEPAVYVVVRGRKQVTVGDETYVYDPSQYLAVSLEIPAVARMVEASATRRTSV